MDKLERLGRKFFGVLFALCLLTSAAIVFPAQTEVMADSSVWDGKSTDTAWQGGGTQGNPYLITSAAELAGLASACQSNSYKGKYFRLTADIVLNANASGYAGWASNPPANLWTPIGSWMHPFSGIFDGAGHTVSGVYTDGSIDRSGLFGHAEYGATIINTGVINSYIKGLYMAGGIIGSNFDGTIENCYNAGVVQKPGGGEGGYSVGGIVGNISGGSVKNCYNTGTMKGATSGAWNYTGGLVGYSENGAILDCCNMGSIERGHSNAGCILGDLKSSTTIENCYSINAVSTIFGYNSNGGSVTNAEIKDNASFTNGEVAYLLNTKAGVQKLWIQGANYPLLGDSSNALTKNVVFKFGNTVLKSIYTNSSKVSEPTELESRAHYISFDGWYNGTDKWNFGGTVPDGVTTLTGKWTPYTFTVQYELNGGKNSSENPVSYTYDTNVVLKDPTRIGYTFAGWYDNPELTGNKITALTSDGFNALNNGGTKTYYAKWAVNTYHIAYELNGGENNPGNPASYIYDTEDIALKNPTKTGYTFAGWYDNPELAGGKVTTITSSVFNSLPNTGTKTYYAKWTPYTFTVQYELNGGKNNSENPVSYTYDINVVLKDPTRTGYTFGGWYDNPELSGNKITALTSEGFNALNNGSTKTYHAKWTANTYHIAYELNGGENYPGNPASYIYDTEDIALKAPMKVSYVFVGWYDNPELAGGKVTTITSSVFNNLSNAGTKTYYAKWTPYTFTVQYELNGGKNNSENPVSYTYDTNVVLKDPTRTGYTFGGWYDNQELTGNKITALTSEGFNALNNGGTKTYYAKWAANTYHIAYELNGGENNPGNPTEYTYGIGAELKDPTRIGYVFRGWYDNQELTGNKVTSVSDKDIENKKYYAKWVDITAPTDVNVSFTKHPFKTVANFITFGLFFKDDVDVNFTAEEYGIGIDYYEYQLVTDGKKFNANDSWLKSSGTFTITADFKGTVYARAVDKAGNVSEYVTKSLVKDTSKPIIQATPSPLKIVASSASILVTVTDDFAGVGKITYMVNGKNLKTIDLAVAPTYTDLTTKYQFKIDSLPDGKYDVIINAEDNSGNAADIVTVHVEKITPAPSPSTTTTTTTDNEGNAVTTVTTVPDTPPTVMEGTASIDATVPQNIAVAVRSATPKDPVKVKIAPPVEAAVQQLTKDDIKTVKVNVNVPSVVANSTNPSTDITITASKDLLQAAKDGKKDVTLTVTDSETGKVAYSWTFKGSNLAGSTVPMKDVDLVLTVQPVKDVPQVSAAVPSAGSGIVLTFGNNGILPAPAEVKIYVGNQGYQPGQTLFFYYFNPDTKKLEKVSDAVCTVDENGYATVTIAHCSDYVLLPQQTVEKTGSITLDTRSYTMSPKNIYDIGVKLENAQNVTVKVHSSRDGIAGVTRLKNGNYRITGLKQSVSYIIFEIYDKNGKLLNHASVKITVVNGVKPHGESVRAKSIF